MSLIWLISSFHHPVSSGLPALPSSFPPGCWRNFDSDDKHAGTEPWFYFFVFSPMTYEDEGCFQFDKVSVDLITITFSHAYEKICSSHKCTKQM